MLECIIMDCVSKKTFTEDYGRLDMDDRTFDVQFWQRQGSAAIFNAAAELIKDYLLLRYHYVNEPEFQRTVESFQKAPV